MADTDRPRSHRRKGFTLVEVLIATSLAGVVMGSVMYFLRMGQQSVVKTTDHADARVSAMHVLDVIGLDLERLVVGNEIDDPDASVLHPFKNWVDDRVQGARFGFYAFHHRALYRPAPLPGQPARPTMVLHAQWIDYHVEKVVNGPGVNLLRNTQVINEFPMHDIKIEKVGRADAAVLGLSAEHCIRVSVLPMGRWDTFNENIWKHNAQSRIFHLTGVESRYAALMSLKRVLASTGEAPPAGYEKVALLPDPPPLDPSDPTAGTVILNWMQPQAVTRIDRAVMFDDDTVDQHVVIPPFPTTP